MENFHLNLLKELPKEVLEIGNILAKGGYESYLVGGSIRDILLKRKVYDFDFATNATPGQVSKIFDRVIPTGIKHGTVTVIYQGKQFEVTTYRSDGSYSDGRHPDKVSFSSSIDEDLKRRDFTINALAFNPLTKEFIDIYQGVNDLKNGVIKTIGDAKERFKEDALRMMRACRFASELQFSLEDNTHQAIQDLKKTIFKVSVERIRGEFIKVIESAKPSVGIEYMRTTGLLDIVFPDIMAGFGVEQNKYHKYDVYYHTLHVLDAVESKDYRLRLSALFHDIAKPIVKKTPENKEEATFYNHELVGAGVARRIMKGLKFSNEDVYLVTHLVKQHMFHYTSEWTDGAVRRFINRVKPENLSLLFQLRKADRIGNGNRSPDCEELQEFRGRIKEIMDKNSALKISDLKIDGKILMKKFAIQPGKIVGESLNYLLEQVLEKPELNNPEDLLVMSENYLSSKSPASNIQK